MPHKDLISLEKNTNHVVLDKKIDAAQSFSTNANDNIKVRYVW